LMSVLTLATSYNINVPVVSSLPLAPLGFNWVVPVVIAGIIGYFIPSKSSAVSK